MLADRRLKEIQLSRLKKVGNNAWLLIKYIV
jgi:hypothetical protein